MNYKMPVKDIYEIIKEIVDDQEEFEEYLKNHTYNLSFTEEPFTPTTVRLLRKESDCGNVSYTIALDKYQFKLDKRDNLVAMGIEYTLSGANHFWCYEENNHIRKALMFLKENDGRYFPTFSSNNTKYMQLKKKTSSMDMEITGPRIIFNITDDTSILYDAREEKYYKDQCDTQTTLSKKDYTKKERKAIKNFLDITTNSRIDINELPYVIIKRMENSEQYKNNTIYNYEYEEAKQLIKDYPLS